MKVEKVMIRGYKCLLIDSDYAWYGILDEPEVIAATRCRESMISELERQLLRFEEKFIEAL